MGKLYNQPQNQATDVIIINTCNNIWSLQWICECSADIQSLQDKECKGLGYFNLHHSSGRVICLDNVRDRDNEYSNSYNEQYCFC